MNYSLKGRKKKIFFYILGYGAEAKATTLQTALFFKENATVAKDNKTAPSPTEIQKFSGYAQRKELVKQSQEVPFCTNLHVDFFQSPRWLPPGVHMRLKFIRNSDEFLIISTEGEAKKFRFKLLSLYVEFRKIQVKTSILNREMSLLKSGKPYVMPFIQGKQTIQTVPSGRLSYYQSELITGILPKQVIIGFVKHENFNGTFKTNPFIFENLKIKSLVFKVNGENSPPNEYTPDFTSTPVDCIRGNIN